MANKLENIVGGEVVITRQHESYDGTLRKVGDHANIYMGFTYGCLSNDEEPLVYDNKLPFLGTKKEYFERIKK